MAHPNESEMTACAENQTCISRSRVLTLKHWTTPEFLVILECSWMSCSADTRTLFLHAIMKMQYFCCYMLRYLFIMNLGDANCLVLSCCNSVSLWSLILFSMVYCCLDARKIYSSTLSIEGKMLHPSNSRIDFYGLFCELLDQLATWMKLLWMKY